ncbi:MAG: NUDIX hydrolase [Planctomycetota bacterium]|jgi:8-oxo-dGTP pyrophosphatase MutT (NUDIX family)
MIRLEEQGVRFQLRVAGVAVHDGRVLLHQAEHEDFWSVPGGRAELLETSRSTLLREMREEIGAEVRVGRLLWIVECFFTHQGETYHELCLYYLMELPPGSEALERESFESEDCGVGLEFRWFPLDELSGLHMLPGFLREALRELPAHPVHVVSDERGRWRPITCRG